jgi:hypothetical protein
MKKVKKVQGKGIGKLNKNKARVILLKMLATLSWLCSISLFINAGITSDTTGITWGLILLIIVLVSSILLFLVKDK